MKKSKVVFLILLLVALTGVLAAVHLTTRDKVGEHEVQLIYQDKTYSVEYKKLDLEQVTGTRVNGKGEEKKVEASGILLRKLLEEKNIEEYSQVTVVSDDSYSAKIAAEEIKEEEKAYLLLQEEELRLVVFGDENSKRSVSNVKQIVVE